MEVHFLDVGCGNMMLILLPNDCVFVYDCNITDDNASSVLAHISRTIGKGRSIDLFINSHRDADHMRGIQRLHARHPIRTIADSGVAGTTTSSSEYREYMDLRRRLPSRDIVAHTYETHDKAKLRWMSAKCDDYAEANDQSIVLKIEFDGASVMLPGDTSFRPWTENILTHYDDTDLSSDILVAAHHGSLSFFDDPSDDKNYYVRHVQKIRPAMTLVSVGPNSNDLPDNKAMELYEKYSSGSRQGNRIYTTEAKGHMKLVLEGGGWDLSTNQ